MIPATEGVLRLQMKSKSSIPCTALVCMPLSCCQNRCHPSHTPSLPLEGPRGCSETGDLLDETSCLWVEESVLWVWAQRPAGSGKALDVVVGGEVVVVAIDAVGGAVRGRHCDCSSEVGWEGCFEGSRVLRTVIIGASQSWGVSLFASGLLKGRMLRCRCGERPVASSRWAEGLFWSSPLEKCSAPKFYGGGFVGWNEDAALTVETQCF